ncbi:MAG: glycine cleavage system protein GcvH [Phycisphaerales bacterium]|nr:glycine cleavage system protein GcvH [Phycisphaerales bacterium]
MSSNPKDRTYSKTHEWFQVNDNIVTMGITQYAADELTDITFVDLPPVGSTIEPGRAFGEIESVKTTSELLSAIGGEIVEVNTALVDQPELVNNDPFGVGWMVRIQAADLSPLDHLLDSRAYDEMIGRDM